MNEFFHMSISQTGDMTGTQIAALIRGREVLMLKMKHGAQEGGKLPFGKYSKLKK